MIDIGIIKEEIENWKNFSINVVEYSEFFHVSVLSDSRRAEIKQKLEDFIVDYKKKYHVDVRPTFLHLFWHLEKPHNKKQAKLFKEFSDNMDKIRNENTLATIPELRELLS